MSEHQRETAFLRQVILYDDTAERHQLEQRITHIQRDERCLARAVWLMVLLITLAAAGLGYGAVFGADHLQDSSRFMTQFSTKMFSALGLGSLICLLAFLGLGVGYRKQLDQCREECRRLATKLLESRLGKPCPMPLPGRIVKNQEHVVSGVGDRDAAQGIVEPRPPESPPAVPAARWAEQSAEAMG